MRMTREERLQAAALTEGTYQRALDPRIGMLMKGRFSSKFHDQPFTTNDDGQRKRARSEIEEGATRIIILGDSVAFGYGVRDDETFAEQLEQQLADARPEDTPRAAVFTIACPGWNFENEYHYLLSRIDELDPDIVIWIPVTNDLDSSFSVTETGHRAVDHDPSAGPTDTFCGLSRHNLIFAGLRATLPGGDVPGSNLHGSSYSLITGITPESIRRYEFVIDGLDQLEKRLALRGAKLAMCHPVEEVFQNRLDQLLSAKGSKLPRFGLFGHPAAHQTLDGDPHFNADALREGARRMAVFLSDSGWVDDVDTSRLLQPDERFADDHYPNRNAKELKEMSIFYDATAKSYSSSMIDLTTGEGYAQIYGGLWHDGIMGRAALVSLKNEGGRSLSFMLRRVSNRPGLYPNTIAVSINGQLVENLSIPSGDDEEMLNRSIKIPEAFWGAAYIDVSFNPYLTTTIMQRKVERLAGVKLLRVAVEK